MNKTTKTLLLALLFVFAVATTFFVTLFASEQILAGGAQTTQKVSEIQSYIDAYYIEDADETAMADAAAAAMVAAGCDDWSYYLNSEEYLDYLKLFENAYTGIGVTIELNEEAGGIEIVSVEPNGSAKEAGIQVGDIIVSIEGKSGLELGVQGAQELVRGEEGTSVSMIIRRGEEKMELSVVRAVIETVVADCTMLDGDVGYVCIYNFDKRCADETTACIDKLIADGATSLLFDVRHNGGGIKDEMVKILDKLLGECVVFSSEDYKGEITTDHSDAESLDMPMAVLVNAYSYSAAEYFAAVLQEYDAAKVFGVQTPGKGYYQVGHVLSDGSYLNLSVGKYYTPAGVSLAENGVTPDVAVKLTNEQEQQLYSGILPFEEDTPLVAAADYLRQKTS